MIQFPIPPEPSTDPSNTFLLLYFCFVVVLLTFETTVLFLPGNWRQRISQLTFGPHWNPNRRGGHENERTF